MKEPTEEHFTWSSIFPCYKQAHEAVESLIEALKTLDKIRDELEEARLHKAITSAYKVSLYLTSIMLTLKNPNPKFIIRYNDMLFALERLPVYNEVLNKEIIVYIFDYEWMWSSTERPTKTHQEAKIKTQACHIQLDATIKKFELQISHYLVGLDYDCLITNNYE